jgi:hypothetical protein
MAAHFLPDINAASTALPNKNFCKQFHFVGFGLKIIGHGNTDNNL